MNDDKDDNSQNHSEMTPPEAAVANERRSFSLTPPGDTVSSNSPPLDSPAASHPRLLDASDNRHTVGSNCEVNSEEAVQENFDSPKRGLLPDYPPQSLRQSTLTNRNVTGWDSKASAFISSTQSSSLELRRLPTEVVLIGQAKHRGVEDFDGKRGAGGTGNDHDSWDDELNNQSILSDASRKRSTRWICFNPQYKLRTQFLLAFGSLAFVAIAMVVVTCVASAYVVRDTTQERFGETILKIVATREGQQVRYLSEALKYRLLPEDEVNIVVQAAVDQTRAYHGDEWGKNTSFMTPKIPFVPLEWNTSQQVPVVNDDNFNQHIQGRYQFFNGVIVSAAAPMFHFQGVCDPDEIDPAVGTYWPDCTKAHNDVSTGGVVSPSNRTAIFYEHARGMAPLLKALFEYSQDVRDLGVYYMNDGAGATTSFPSYPLNSQQSYTSAGCDWMDEPHPFVPGRTVGTPEQKARCRPAGTVVNSRLYNPMERQWCVNQVLLQNDDRILIDGPYLDAFSIDTWMFSVGRAVYDPETNDFVACTLVGLTVHFVEDILRKSRVFPDSELSMARPVSGDVLASSAWDIRKKGGTPPAITDMGLGVTPEILTELDELVDYGSLTEETWDVEALAKLYMSRRFVSNDQDSYQVSAYPFPPLPRKYEASYRPQFWTILSTSTQVFEQPVEEANEGIDEEVELITLISTVMGVASLLVFGCVLVFMSGVLTEPLVQMNETARLIVKSFGDDNARVDVTTGTDKSNSNEDNVNSDEGHDGNVAQPQNSNASGRLIQTEINDLEKAFQKMVDSFAGGSLLPKAEKVHHLEVVNSFPMRPQFLELYLNREGLEGPAFASGSSKEAIHDNINLGSNLGEGSETFEPPRKEDKDDGDVLSGGGGSCSSPLFLWTLFLLALPLLVVMLMISIVSISSMIGSFNEASNDLESFMIDFQVQNLDTVTGLRSSFYAATISRSIRDLYMVTRVSGWMLLGGLQPPDREFPPLLNRMEDCKMYESVDDCPAALADRVCDCAWNEGFDDCQEYPTGASRLLQFPHYAVSSDSALPNGTRLATDFPASHTSANNTAWWKTEDFPNKADDARSPPYATTYSRARLVGEALNLVMPVHNYARREEHRFNVHFALDDDGAFAGWEGCSTYSLANLSRFQASSKNGAPDVRPELCPDGRYGFDPRCREWYHASRQLVSDHGVPFRLTEPYLFWWGGVVGVSASAAVVDPSNNHFVGQSLMDFFADDILQTLPRDFGFLMTPVPNRFGHDLVYGPGFEPTRGKVSMPVADLIMAGDIACHHLDGEGCSMRRMIFDGILDNMRTCQAGSASFERLDSSGSLEMLYMSYAPVNISFLTPLDASDFAAGATFGADYCQYVVAKFETASRLIKPFAEDNDKFDEQTSLASIILGVVIVAGVLVIVIVSYFITRRISQTMNILSDGLRQMEKRGSGEFALDIDTSVGSKEVVNMVTSLETLFEVVRFANLAFYAGEVDTSYRVLRDSMRIFKKIGNDKALGVACNNLGNIMLEMYREMKSDDLKEKCGLSLQEVIQHAIAYFHDAIKLGEAAYERFYEAEGWTPNCLDFMQHLSNRYFNRGMFLLQCLDDHPDSAEIKRLGLRDIQIAHDMDVEIVDQGEEVGWGRINRATKVFDVALTRIHGLLLLMALGLSDEETLEEMLESLFNSLGTESRKKKSDLFDDLSYNGRVQEVEAAQVKYFMVKKEWKAAAQVAIRALYEDEYLLNDFKEDATQALQAYMKSDRTKWNDKAIEVLKRWVSDSAEVVSAGFSSDMRSSQFIKVLNQHILPPSASFTIVSGDETRRPSASTRSTTMENF